MRSRRVGGAGRLGRAHIRFLVAYMYYSISQLNWLEIWLACAPVLMTSYSRTIPGSNLNDSSSEPLYLGRLKAQRFPPTRFTVAPVASRSSPRPPISIAPADPITPQAPSSPSGPTYYIFTQYQVYVPKYPPTFPDPVKHPTNGPIAPPNASPVARAHPAHFQGALLCAGALDVATTPASQLEYQR